MDTPSLLILTDPIKVSVRLHSSVDQLEKRIDRARCPWPILTDWDRSRARISNHPYVFLGLIILGCQSLTGHLLDAHMPEKRHEICHFPRSRPVDAVGREFFGRVAGRIEEAESCGDEGRDLAVGEADEETLAVVVWDFGIPICGSAVVGCVKLLHKGRCCVQPWKSEIWRERIAMADHVIIFHVPATVSALRVVYCMWWGCYIMYS